jgi:hypothetical protein
MYSRKGFLILAFAVGWPAGQVIAQSKGDPAAEFEERTPWVLGVAAQTDDESNRSVLSTLNVGVGEETWLSVSAGRSRAPANRADVVADTVEFGLDHRFGLVGLTAHIEQWGDSKSLESSNRSASIYFQTDKFRIALEHEKRDIDIHFTVTVLGRPFSRTAQLDSHGSRVSASVDVAQKWRLYGSRMQHSYSRNLTLLPLVDRLNFLSTSSLTLANSFVSETSLFGLEGAFGDRLLNLSSSSDRSEVDGTRFTSFDVALLLPVARRMDLEINIGRGDSDLVSSGLYGGVLLLFYGGG